MKLYGSASITVMLFLIAGQVRGFATRLAVRSPQVAAPSAARVRAPTTGQDMTVTVPAGVEAGGLFDVPLPEPRLPSLGE